ncbi:MAG: hypothetical protein COT81_04755 [Candidatus Buchananbacteria bacterium CG10_big_fil_rev_8_21_14_0_10_42_9]|uniref:Thioester reductase (TE) domain-containing protein n=1 Tax=Candidatus Buchananbacteria bacterium CG10_big_fil_rev_8_21_14_0_10_42_9 TaxID=1974526 RepID=A0A2H0W0E1_9BACT|nr:MAG: hypothetical protein COT81_04755 [Candidatus Buchananbacteria bacterium CG10_big_fil_rev_8_21_14_0_10_42_9]
MRSTILITGATGMIGRCLTEKILDQTDMWVVLLVHKQGEDLSKKDFVKKFLNNKNSPDVLKRIEIVSGDIVEPQLSKKLQLSQLASKITHVFHLAASTRFDLDLQVARSINVVGTQNILEFAKQCPNLLQFGFASTAYVSGKRTGTVMENEYRHSDGFVNSYEQSKYEAEELIIKHWDDIPAAIYRFSTIIGDSQTGGVSHFTAPHQSLRLMHLGLASMIPGTPEYKVDLIPTDYAVETTFQLFINKFQASTLYHIVSGNDKSFTLQEMIDESYKCLANFDPVWEKRQYPKPVITSESAFNLFLDSAKQAKNPFIHKVMSAMQHFAHQLNYPKEFDMTNTILALPDYQKQLPHIGEYYSRVVKYCLEVGWGKKI